MKSALILEKDAPSYAKTSCALRWLGYVTAPVRTPDEALNALRAVNFDIVVTWTSNRPGDRRTLTSELKRAAPDAAVVLITENDDCRLSSRTPQYTGTNAVIKRPVSSDVLRRIVEFGIDGYGLQPCCIAAPQERRKKRA